MSERISRIRSFLGALALAAMIGLAVLGTNAHAQTSPVATAHDGDASTHYSYRLISDRSIPSRVELEFDGAGKGSLTLSGNIEHDMQLPIYVKQSTFANLAPLFDALNFFDSGQIFQAAKETPKAGLVTIGFKRGSQERRVSFNNTENGVMVLGSSLTKSGPPKLRTRL